MLYNSFCSFLAIMFLFMHMTGVSCKESDTFDSSSVNCGHRCDLSSLLFMLKSSEFLYEQSFATESGRSDYKLDNIKNENYKERKYREYRTNIDISLGLTENIFTSISSSYVFKRVINEKLGSSSGYEGVNTSLNYKGPENPVFKIGFRYVFNKLSIGTIKVGLSPGIVTARNADGLGDGSVSSGGNYYLVKFLFSRKFNDAEGSICGKVIRYDEQVFRSRGKSDYVTNKKNDLEFRVDLRHSISNLKFLNYYFKFVHEGKSSSENGNRIAELSEDRTYYEFSPSLGIKYGVDTIFTLSGTIKYLNDYNAFIDGKKSLVDSNYSKSISVSGMWKF